jgi:hypothetical protein
MQLKEGVRIHGVQPEIVLAIEILDGIYLADHADVYPHGVVVTSICDGTHSENSLHYSGCAFDCRVWFLDVGEITKIAEDARAQLGEDFDVRIEKDHLHVGWKPHKL